MSTPSSSTLSSSGTEFDLESCVGMMRAGSKTFFAASRLLPQRMRAASVALYAFCRVADDLVDGAEYSPTQSLKLLHHRLDRVYQGQPTEAIEDQALALVVQQYQLPRLLLDGLLEGFAWDAEGRRYDTLEQLHSYAARVAGTVGGMMCWIMGIRNPVALARACELGVAMQLTNIARDVGDDARMGRIYLPYAWLQEAGITPQEWLQQPECTPALQSVVSRLLLEADRLYEQASAGIADLPKDCRPAILAARLIYAEIGHQLRRNGLNSVNHRAVVGTPTKLMLLGQSHLSAAWIKAAEHPPKPLDAIAYLVDGCMAQKACEPALAIPSTAANSRSAVDKIEWMLVLFERLAHERRDAMEAPRVLH